MKGHGRPMSTISPLSLSLFHRVSVSTFPSLFGIDKANFGTPDVTVR